FSLSIAALTRVAVEDGGQVAPKLQPGVTPDALEDLALACRAEVRQPHADRRGQALDDARRLRDADRRVKQAALGALCLDRQPVTPFRPARTCLTRQRPDDVRVR